MRSRSFWLVTTVGFGELGSLLLLGETTMTPTAVVVIAVLVLWLGASAVGSSTGGSGGDSDWGNVAVICVGPLSC